MAIRRKARKTVSRPKAKPASALGRALRERDEAQRFQAATGEILASLSRSIGDAKPVFEAIVENVLRVFGTRYAAVFIVEGDQLHLGAAKGDAGFEKRKGAVFTRFRDSFPQRIDYKGFTGKALRSGKVSQLAPVIGNPKATPQAVELAKTFGYDAMLVAPLMREGKAIGAIGTTRPEGKPFDDRALALFEAFAAQAVIAIENARLFHETTEALERQTATSEVLKTISRSTFDLNAVLQVLIENATRLAGASRGFIFRFDGQVARLAFSYNAPPAYRDLIEANPIPPGRGTLVARTLLEGRPVHIPDVLADPGFTWHEAQRLGGFRSMLGVPMTRDGKPIGVIAMWSDVVKPFTDKQIELVATFADQAVIAIENVRLFNETKEALERQTATSEVLRVISESHTDTTPVFDAIIRSAVQLCGATYGSMVRVDDGVMRLWGHYNYTTEALQLVQQRYPAPISEQSLVGLAVRTKGVVHSPDFENDPRTRVTPYVKALGVRAQLTVPLMREGEVIGTLNLLRKTPGPFSDAQVEVLKSFAAQAVIAIENVRLFNETKEALERQTATAEILKVISGSPTDVQPVFDAIVRGVSRLFGRKAALRTVEAGGLRRRARSYEPAPGEYHGREVEPIDRRSIVGQAVLEGRALQWRDTLVEGAATYGLEEARKLAFRSIASAPLMRGGRAIGVISVSSPTPGLLSHNQMGLLITFADQAVIAIENTRLFNETKEALERQTATADVLKVISGSPTDVTPVFDAILKSAVTLCDAELAAVFAYDGNLVHMVATHNWPEEALRYFSKIYPSPPSPKLLSGRTILTKAVVEITDSAADPDYDPTSVVTGHWRRMLGAPMLREGRPLGVLVVAWREPGETPQRQVDLLQTFADQAAIAIENVRLFNETKEALDQQKASADVLQVISNSIADTRPVFERILESCRRLFGGHDTGIGLVGDDGLVHLAAHQGPMAEELQRVFPVPLSRESGTGSAILEKAVKHYPDVFGDANVPEYVRKSAEKVDFKSVIFAPMYWEGNGIGAIWIGRSFAGAFTEKQIALLKTFADQAVIAIQNARLFREIQEKSAQLEVANKHKSDFLASMSHELRTPLNAIIGFSEVLSERMFGEVNEKQAEYLKDIHESGRHLLSLINDILDLSKIEAGRMELELSRFHLPSAVSNAMTLVRERAQRHGIQLAVAMEPGLGELQADERKVKQILLNLLSNAVKFTPDGGRVDVSARKADGKVEIAVKDTGIGIAPEDHAAVFEEFKQVGRDYTRKAEGTGLGLALTRRLVELHGGDIALESAPGKGSTFTVRLPLR